MVELPLVPFAAIVNAYWLAPVAIPFSLSLKAVVKFLWDKAPSPTE